MMGFLYRLVFPNGKCYIGITCSSPSRRYRDHKRAVSSGKNTRLYAAWRKYGDPALEVLKELPKEELPSAEIKAIKEFNSQLNGGYNMTPGGDFSPMLLPDVVKRFSESKKGIAPPRKAMEAAILATKGKKRPAEVVAKMSLNSSMRRPEVLAKQRATMALPSTRLKLKMAQLCRYARKAGIQYSDLKSLKKGIYAPA